MDLADAMGSGIQPAARSSFGETRSFIGRLLWRTRDQLQLSIMASLSRAIHDAPGIGWVRGSAGHSDAVVGNTALHFSPSFWSWTGAAVSYRAIMKMPPASPKKTEPAEPEPPRPTGRRNDPSRGVPIRVNERHRRAKRCMMPFMLHNPETEERRQTSATANITITPPLLDLHASSGARGQPRQDHQEASSTRGAGRCTPSRRSCSASSASRCPRTSVHAAGGVFGSTHSPPI